MASVRDVTGWRDKWVVTRAKELMPRGAVRIPGELNQYVAVIRWKHRPRGPAFGYASNEAGRVDYTFISDSAKRPTDRNHNNAVLTYKANSPFVYKWVPLTEVETFRDQWVKTMDSAPVLLYKGPACRRQAFLGELNLKTNMATILINGKVEMYKSSETENLHVLVRDYSPIPQRPLNQDNQYRDVRCGDPVPKHCHLVKLGTERREVDGRETEVDTCVAVWHNKGLPIFGRCWVDPFVGGLDASFGCDGHEFTGEDVGSFQVLVWDKEGLDNRFSYHHSLYSERTGKAVTLGGFAPCLLRQDWGGERLGRVRLRTGIASASDDGIEIRINGPVINHFLILTRTNLPHQPCPPNHFCSLCHL